MSRDTMIWNKHLFREYEAGLRFGVGSAKWRTVPVGAAMSRCVLELHDRLLVKRVKSILEENQLFDKQLKIVKNSSGSFTIPLTVQNNDENTENYLRKLLPDVSFDIVSATNNAIQTKKCNSLESKLESLFKSVNVDAELQNILINQFPKRHSIYTPLLLLPSNSFETKEWKLFISSLSAPQKDELYRLILSYLSTPTNTLTHLAINKPIPEDDNVIRSPSHLTKLFGDFNDFWCHTTQNGIYQTWNPTETMFSRGNIKEKARILNTYTDINNSADVVDLYAGIGYFTLSYLKRNARRLFCWEINPYSVEGLYQGVVKNGFGDCYIIKRGESIDLDKVVNSRCVVFLESNVHCLERFAELVNLGFKELNISHINLGLLPSSKDSWPYACNLIDQYGVNTSWIHVHENIGVSELPNFMNITNKELQALTETATITPVFLEKVKTFAPDVYHIVGDFKLVKRVY